MKRTSRTSRPFILLLFTAAGLLASGGCSDSSSTTDSRRSTPTTSKRSETARRVSTPRADAKAASEKPTESVPRSWAENSAKSPDTPNAAGKANEPGASQEPANIAPLARVAPVVIDTSRVAKVLLTEQHKALCKVKTDDPMPEILLPNLSGESTNLSSLFGERLTVVCFWKGDRAFARMELADLGPDVAAPFSGLGVAVVGVAVEESADSAAKLAKEAGGAFPVLIDAEGKAFATVGAEKLPRTYLLDAQGRILWFDIEYSRSTRRELLTAIKGILGAS